MFLLSIRKNTAFVTITEGKFSLRIIIRLKRERKLLRTQFSNILIFIALKTGSDSAPFEIRLQRIDNQRSSQSAK